MASDGAHRVLQYELADDDTEPDEDIPIPHPAAVAAARIMAAHPNEPRERERELDRAIRSGIASAYFDLGEDDIHIPPSHIRGCHTQPTRAGTQFTACLRVSNGKLRVDHTGDHAFWLEVDLPPVMMEAYMAWKYRPGGEAAQRAAEKFEQEMGRFAAEPKAETEAAVTKD